MCTVHISLKKNNKRKRKNKKQNMIVDYYNIERSNSEFVTFLEQFLLSIKRRKRCKFRIGLKVFSSSGVLQTNGNKFKKIKKILLKQFQFSIFLFVFV